MNLKRTKTVIQAGLKGTNENGNDEIKVYIKTKSNNNLNMQAQSPDSQGNMNKRILLAMAIISTPDLKLHYKFIVTKAVWNKP